MLLTVVDGDREPVPDVVVTASWDEGEDDLVQCTTNEDGACRFTSSALAKHIKSTAFRVEDVGHDDLPYLAHLDTGRAPDDSVTTLTIHKP